MTVHTETNQLQIDRIALAAQDSSCVGGYTHNFYRYPARFSPQFVSTAIDCFSSPGDVVLDPYMGGATTLVEAMISGRRSIGVDINELATFVASCKICELSIKEYTAVTRWANEIVPNVRSNDVTLQVDSQTVRNMHLPKTRWLRKNISALLNTIARCLPTRNSRRFARCVLLSAGQRTLNGRRHIPTAPQFRDIVRKNAHEMLTGMLELSKTIAHQHFEVHRPLICSLDAEEIDLCKAVQDRVPVDLVITSPPYPGIHTLYHRWQVDGRKETDAPYWIAGCTDGAGPSYYNFADRRPHGIERYFDKAARTFSAIRNVMRRDAILVQMIAFSDPSTQLPRYLALLESCGFTEFDDLAHNRIWRSVPSRKWYAAQKGPTNSSREVVLLHKAA